MARTYERPKSGSPFFPEDGPAGGGVDLYMTRAMTSGFLDDYRHPSNVTGACDSEHCSWRPFSTLAICASIEDVSSSVINATNGTGFNETQFALRGVPIDPPAAKFQKTFWMDSLNLANRGEINPPTDSPAKMPALTEVYTVFFPPCNDEGNDREDSSKREQFYETQNWRAYKASFNLCIQTLQADFNITMNTTVINQEDKDIEWQKGESESDVGGEWCTERDDENLCIGNQTMQGMARELAALFVGSASLIPAGDNYFDGQWSPTLVTDVLGSDPTACDPDYLPLHGIRGFTKRMHNIAVSMSNAMRTANTSTTFTGIAWDRQPFISVQFAWFSFPALLYLATTLFFFAMLVETRRVDAPIWKSSPLALLQTMHPDNKMETLKEIEQDAQRTSVRLRYNGEMWQLRETTRRNQDQIL
ncbi:hypothetical protein EJ04DRAFT_480683 [Polyplosphaeria fusca]|uniref:Uncharacterized protein n=1 Tax=Polyplosphaeria fusca TaxID=682080 RepID=A0A9P4RD71_9PLEO|nr:hypothetical protein EJ04DRAFT_480683 [Polyplosphaeria fusca]